MSGHNFITSKLLGTSNRPDILFVPAAKVDTSIQWSITNLDSQWGVFTKLVATLTGAGPVPVLVQQALSADAADAEWATVTTLSYTALTTVLNSETLAASGSTLMPYLRLKISPPAGTTITLTDIRRTTRGLA
jgi:hypothetical protein